MNPTLLNNRYRILQTLGAGGFGNTFLAEDTYMPSGRRCVIKQLKPIIHEPQTEKLVQERFQREAAVLEELGEGNNQIPRLYAYFSEAGQFYLVQEWIEGDTLTKKVEREGKLNESEVTQILIRLLSVLDYVHSRYMVHRDIKPDNVIIRQRDQLPVLIDFGAVKEALKTAINPQASANQSMVIGTPGFMPAEQAAGRPIYASDLYSLGLTAIFLLTGKLPQALETDLQTGEILWRRDAPNCHSNLASVLDRAIRFHPRDRFTSAKEMLQALQSQTSSLTQATVAVSPGGLPPVNPSAVPPTVPIPRRRNQLENFPIVGGLVLGGLLIGAVVVGLGLNRALQRSNSVSTSPELTSEIPTVEPTFSPTPSSLPEPLSTPTPESTLSPSPLSPTRLPDPTFPQSSEPPSTSTPELILPEASESPSTPNPSPTPMRSSPSPSIPLETNDLTPNSTQTIPGFAPGTQQKTVESTLGNPTKNSKGLWQNTRALLYEDFVPNQVSLGYLFDRTSGRLRQTEVAFAQSVGLEMMSETLNQILDGNVSGDIQNGLERVYQRRANRYRFTTGRGNLLKGVIERNDKDRIYIGVWEADLH